MPPLRAGCCRRLQRVAIPVETNAPIRQHGHRPRQMLRRTKLLVQAWVDFWRQPPQRVRMPSHHTIVDNVRPPHTANVFVVAHFGHVVPFDWFFGLVVYGVTFERD